MSLAINAFPSIDPSGYFRARREYDPILCQRRFFPYSSGRAALYHAIKTAGLPAESRILVPSFHCGVEVEAVKRAGCQSDFYDIRRDLNIDFEDLERRVTGRTRGIIVIHYFGFPQNMERTLTFCHENELVLFEDCAHALYSSFRGRWVGSFGAFGIFSLRKTIALPNGGGLLCNSPEYADPPAGKRYIDYQLLKSTVKSMLEYEAKEESLPGRVSRGILSLYASIHVSADEHLKGKSARDAFWYYDTAQCDYQNGISGLSAPLLRKESYVKILKKRREHYRVLNEGLGALADSVRLVEDLEEGVCPLCYVVSVENRDRLVSEMRRLGVNPFVFGALPHACLSASDFPEVKFLSDRLVGLPVHQQLSEQDIEKVANVFIHAMNECRRLTFVVDRETRATAH